MAAVRRINKVMASRRRREDDGEEEGSTAADLDDDSLSEGSILSNGDDDADGEPSDISGDEMVQDQRIEPEPPQSSSPRRGPKYPGRIGPDTQQAAPQFSTSSDTNTMTNGLRLQTSQKAPAIGAKEDVAGSPGAAVGDSSPQLQHPKETFPERTRREHMEYLRQRRENPAFVPNRGGFFLHDNRAATFGPNGIRGGPRARGRGFHHPFPQSRAPPHAAPTDQPWAHDLHESVSNAISANRPINPTRMLPHLGTVDASRTSSGHRKDLPNRTFSSSTLLGKIPIGILFPGMREKIIVQNVAKKKHTLLPHHRPPLRRDKPVRVSIPTQQPRYIFPSTERSFIFISRALRPNQQGFRRGRGRSSVNQSRGTSVYGGSNCTSSVAVSRRSSLGGVMHPDEIRSSGGPPLALPLGVGTEPGKPIVRFPPAARATGSLVPPATHQSVDATNPTGPAEPAVESGNVQENLTKALPMYQPRPQKTVSMADIESPGKFNFSPPQQQEQPFHQQMPPLVNHQSYLEDGLTQHAQPRRLSRASRASATPLSQIPEKAIHAQPFQPFNLPPMVPGYLPSPYGPGSVFYPGMEGDPAAYHPGLGPPPMLPPAFLPAAQAPPYMVPAAPPPPLPAHGPAEGSAGGGTVAHESNGMVYYYDSSHVPPNTGAPYPVTYIGPSLGGPSEMGGVMTPANHAFYPDAPSGVYYAAS